MFLAVSVLVGLHIPFSWVLGRMMTTHPGNNCTQYENNCMKFGTFFTLFKESSREYETDESKISINYNKAQDDQNAGTLWVVEFWSSNGGGGCWIQLSLPSLAMPNSATHLRVGVMFWSVFNEMEKSGPSNFIHVNPTQTKWTSPLPDFPHQRNIERVALFSALWVKVTVSFGLGGGLL